jgi:hypothetical protein
MKESIRYKNGIMQFIENFKPPSKKGKGDDSSSVGTAVSLGALEEEELGEIGEPFGKKSKKPRKPRPTINMSSLMFNPSKVLAVPSIEASELEPGALVEAEAEAKQKPKPKPRLKGTGKGITINTSGLGLALPERKEEQPMPMPVSTEPAKKTKAKKVTINTSKLPVFGAKALLPPQQRPNSEEEQDTGLSDIQEASEELSPP